MKKTHQKRKQKNKNLLKSYENKERILWVSNAPWTTTGYGQQTAQVTSRLKKDYEVAVAVNYGLEGSKSYWQSPNGPVQIYPRGHDTYSNEIISAHAQDWFLQNKEVNNLIITLFDTWVFQGEMWKKFQIASWTPIDHYPTPPRVLRWCKQENVIPIAMSKYGQEMLKRENIDSFYIPHAIEDDFQPIENVIINNQKITNRKFLGIPEDAFVVGMNAANKGVYPNRKAFGENLMAFYLFAQDKPNAVLYIHADPTPTMGGIDIIQLAQAIGLKQNQIIFTDRYSLRGNFSQKDLAIMYSCFDVLLATSMGEGFGIPTIEAQACGVPVIVSDFTASSELCGDGWLIDGQNIYDAPQVSWLFVPFVDSIVDALQSAYQRPKTLSEKAIQFANQYRAEEIYRTHWKPNLQAILGDKTSDPISTTNNNV